MRMTQRSGRFARKAMSLLEMLAVVMIIGIISSVVVPRVAFQAFWAKEKACLQYRSDINAAIERYMFDEGAPPADLSDLQNSDYYPDAIPICPVDKAAYTIDPTTHRVAGHDH